MSAFYALPAEGQTNLAGDRVCRWCRTKLETTTYVPVKKRKRREVLTCPKCDAGSVKWVDPTFTPHPPV